MRNTVKNKLNALLLAEEKQSSIYSRELKNAPKGSLYIKKSKKYLSIYKRVNGKEYGIKRNENEVQALARKNLIEYILETKDINCMAIRMALDYIESQEKERFSSREITAYENVKQIASEREMGFTKAQIDWMKEQYDTNMFKAEHLKYKTQKGEMVRSKSERIIANKLEEHGIAYRYESKIAIAGHDYYPDFTILRVDGSKVLWEHLGLIENNDYFFKTFLKIDNYRKAGFVQHDNLICTYEEDIEAEENLDSIIYRYIL